MERCASGTWKGGAACIRSARYRAWWEISDEGLRFYERSGVIHPIKDERGRRYFKTLDINVLMRIRGYRNMGFSLDQCASMVNDLNAGEVCREFQNQEEELEREIRWRKPVHRPL